MYNGVASRRLYVSSIPKRLRVFWENCDGVMRFRDVGDDEIECSGGGSFPNLKVI